MIYRSTLRWRPQLLDGSFICSACQRASFNSAGRHYARRAPTTPRKDSPRVVKAFDAETLKFAQSNPEEIKRLKARDRVALDTSNDGANFDPIEQGGKLLETAHKVGFLKITPETASAFIEALFKLQEKPTLLVFKRLCAEYRISLDAAYSLARLLLRSKGDLDRHSGRQILLLSSRAGSAKATVYVAKTALKQKQLNAKDVQPSLQHLDMLAKLEYPIIPALVVKAKICEEKLEYKEAVLLYQKATAAGSVKETRTAIIIKKFKDHVAGMVGQGEDLSVTIPRIVVEEDDTELDITAAHLNLGDLQYKDIESGQMVEGIKNWRIAALRYDDPNAYYNLARQIEGEIKHKNRSVLKDTLAPSDFAWFRWATYEWYEFMLKAAASGHGKASFSIALFHMSPFYQDIFQDRKLAQVLASRPIRPSNLTWIRLAVINRSLETSLHDMGFIVYWFETAAKLGQGMAVALAYQWLVWVSGQCRRALASIAMLPVVAKEDVENMARARYMWRWLIDTKQGREIARFVGAKPAAELDEDDKKIRKGLKEFGPPS